MSRMNTTVTTPKAVAPDSQKSKAKPFKRVSLTQYVGFFVIGYIIASAVFMMIQTQITLEPQLINALSLFVGSYVAVYKFINHHKRALTTKEINRLTRNSSAAVWLLTALYFLLLWLWVFDIANREVLIENTMQQPMPLLFALAMMLLLTLIWARLGIWAMNLLLNPTRKAATD